MIPKVIHYCWFGRGPKSEIIQKCMASWREFCPDYEIIEWNEDNFDVNSIPYTADAYADKKWAFVSDYARLKIIYEHGGIYLDTDVELKNSLDSFLKYDCWLSQDDIRYINTGLGFGAIKGNELIGVILRKRESLEYDGTICNAIDTPIIRNYLSLKQSRNSQEINGAYILGMLEYPQYASHREVNSWKTEASYHFHKRRIGKYWQLKSFLRNPAVINWLERNGETLISRLYVFCAYDLLDNGPIYFAKRLIRKVAKKLFPQKIND